VHGGGGGGDMVKGREWVYLWGVVVGGAFFWVFRGKRGKRGGSSGNIRN